MENYSKENNTCIFNSSSSLLNNNKGINYEQYINKNNINNNNNKNNEINTHKNVFPKMNMNSFYINMVRYNLINSNFFKPISINTRINSLLTDFNKELEKDYNIKEKNKNIINDNDNDNKNKIKNNLNNHNFEPLIKKLESQNDERFKKSRFLQFIKDINSNKLIINEEKNIIEQNVNYISNNENKDNNVNDNNNIDNNEKDKNEFEDLLNQVKTYMNYSREDLAKNILETIFDNSKIKLKENKKYLEQAYLFMILCYFNENEDLIGISLMVDLLNLICEGEGYNNENINEKRRI